MNKKKVFGYVMTGVLSVGLISGLGTTAFAATSSSNTATKQTVKSLDTATQEKVQKIRDSLKTQLAELGVTLPEHKEKGNLLTNLDDATKAKAEDILKKEQNGSISRDEAKTQLEKLGVTLPNRDGKGKINNLLANLDTATKAKAEDILKKEQNGSISHDEAKTQLEKLGVTLPNHDGKGKIDNLLANLDTATKAKAKDILKKEQNGSISHDEAKTQLEKLGITLPNHDGKRKIDNLLTNLDDATKAKAQKLIDDANAQLEKLGVKRLKF